MIQFGGFPTRTEFVPVPVVFLSQLMPFIDDVAELKITLHLFRLLYPRKGFPRFVTYTELANDKNMKTGLKTANRTDEDILKRSLSLAVKRGTFLSLRVNKDGGQEEVFMLNTVADRDALEKIRRGEVRLPGLDRGGICLDSMPESVPNVYSLYESNIGILTPMVAEELKDAEKNYPQTWIEAAIKEAVNANKRNWRYIAHMLERWSTEGKKDGTYSRDTKKTDSEKYFRGKYGEFLQR